MNADELIEKVETAIHKALHGESKLDADVLAIKGFSTPKMRHLFNNLCSLPDATYLECGLWAGASFCAALCNNETLTAIGIEDFSQPFHDETIWDQLQRNLEDHRHHAKSVRIINCDCFSMHKSQQIPSLVDILFFDANHSYESQAAALPYFFPLLAKSAIVVVDDYQWADVRRGTEAGIAALKDKIKIERHWDLVGKQKQDDPVWHNGLGIWVVEKL